jgi:glycosyltransferase involved in cell wall biosynthesis
MLKKILMIGPDLTSNGGIASVVKTIVTCVNENNFNINYDLLKVNYYKDKNRLYELIIFIKSLSIFFIKIFNNYDVLHFHSSSNLSFYRISIFIILGKYLSKSKIVLHIHSSNFYEFFIDTCRAIKIKNYVFHNCDYIIVLCEDWKKKIETKYRLNNVKVVYNPIAIRKQSTKKSLEKFTVLYLGFLIKSKGVLDIIKIAKNIKEKINNKIKFVIAGKGELKRVIKKQIVEFDLIDTIDLVGWLDAERKEEFLSNSDILLLPSYKEGMPISILEAVSHSLPIISTNISGIPEIVINNFNGFLLAPGDISGFVQKIIYLYNNKEVLENFRLNNTVIVKNFDSKSIVEILETIYREKIITR